MMARYLVGALLVSAGALAAALWMSPRELAAPAWWLAGLLVALPLGTSWAVAEGVDRWRPRRVFDPRLRRPWTLLGAGMLAAAAANILATLMLALVPSLPDAGVIALCTACANALTLLCALSPSCPGACIHCRYELAPDQPRCPECGAVGSRVSTRPARRPSWGRSRAATPPSRA